VARNSGHGNALSDSINGGKFLDHLGDRQLIKMTLFLGVVWLRS
jgi:hypothetical protein